MENAIKSQLKESIDIKSKIIEGFTDQIINIIKAIITSYKNEGKVILLGNGGSAADAQHIAAEFVGRFAVNRPPLPAIALTTDSSILTAVGNDYGFNKIFARQVEAIVNENDVVIGISTSGNSPNVLEALKVAKGKGATIIGFSGVGGKLSDIVDISFNVPSNNTPRIQEVHITVLHIICDQVEKRFLEGIGH
ncbi:MAG: D-sedoheptulose 7-phosphate isomerase [Clostridiales bacterium]|nr:D-sedoheptulose 7-phosphate isomerase [Clostridiales bacterium]